MAIICNVHRPDCIAGNYGAGLKALLAASKEGFTDVVYLDARTDTYLEELSAANIFVVKVSAAHMRICMYDCHHNAVLCNCAFDRATGCSFILIASAQGKTVKTPPLVGTILPGITRASILALAKRLGFQAEEAPISIDEALQADEVFTTGAWLQLVLFATSASGRHGCEPACCLRHISCQLVLHACRHSCRGLPSREPDLQGREDCFLRWGNGWTCLSAALRCAD
jgi:Amino-transferase class IV